MGNPANYSLELPERCLKLLEGLWPHAQKIRQVERPDLGPMTSTFLISMSMAMINIPIERIERRQGGEGRHYADDRKVNPKAAKAIAETLGRRLLCETPFFVKDAWRFARYKEPPFPNIARGVPDPVAAELGSRKAAQEAADMQVSQWCSVLRNALAHGGIAYLNTGPKFVRRAGQDVCFRERKV